MPTTQQQLPFDKREYAMRVSAIEQLKLPGFTAGKAKCIRRLVKFIFKHKRSSYEGTMTFVCTEDRKLLKPHQLSLALELEISRRCAQDWIKWSKAAGLVDATVSCDSEGTRRTTLEICWSKILGGDVEGEIRQPVGPDQGTGGYTVPAQRKLATVNCEQPVNKWPGPPPDLPDQSASSVDQSASSVDQSASSVDQSASDALSYSTNYQYQTPESGVRGSTSVGVEVLERKSVGDRSAIAKPPTTLDDVLATWPEIAQAMHEPEQPLPIKFIKPVAVWKFFDVDDRLANKRAVCHWFREQLSLRRPLFAASTGWKILVLAAAIHASECPQSRIRKNRVAYFANTVTRGHWRRCEQNIEAAIEFIESLQPAAKECS